MRHCASGAWALFTAPIRRCSHEDAIEKQGGRLGHRRRIPAARRCARCPERPGLSLYRRDFWAQRHAIGHGRDPPGAVRAARSSAPASALISPATHVVTLTVSEKGYCLNADGELDFSHPDIAADLAMPDAPRSAIGWLALALAQRHKNGAGPLTILSCDNLQSNGERLAAAVRASANAPGRAWGPGSPPTRHFPSTLVDCIVPASRCGASRPRPAGTGHGGSSQRAARGFCAMGHPGPFCRTAARLGRGGRGDRSPISMRLSTAQAACPQRRPFGPGLSGPAAGHIFVRQAIADPDLLNFLDAMVAQEIAPALAPLDVAGLLAHGEGALRQPDDRPSPGADRRGWIAQAAAAPVSPAGRPTQEPAATSPAWRQSCGPGWHLMATAALRAIPPMPGWRTGPGPAPTRPRRWTMKRCFPISFAATHACAARCPRRLERESRAPHFAARPSTYTSFLPPYGGAVRRGKMSQRGVCTSQTRVATEGGEKNGGCFKAAASNARYNSRGKTALSVTRYLSDRTGRPDPGCNSCGSHW